MISFLLSLTLLTHFLDDSRSLVKRDILVENEGRKIYGQLWSPQNSNNPNPLIIFISGTGRANIPSWFAKHYASKGIACLVFDKEGIGNSGGKFPKHEVTPENIKKVGNDVSILLDHILDNDTKFSKIGIFGFSLGASIGAYTCQINPNVDFYISVSGVMTNMKQGALKQDSTKKTLEKPRSLKKWNKRLSNILLNSEYDFDPVTSLNNSKGLRNAIFIYGKNDIWIPVEASVQNLKDNIRDDINVTVEIMGEGHSCLFDWNNSPPFVSEIDDYLCNWLFQEK